MPSSIPLLEEAKKAKVVSKFRESMLTTMDRIASQKKTKEDAKFAGGIFSITDALFMAEYVFDIIDEIGDLTTKGREEVHALLEDLARSILKK